jgi:hypothetical protein
VIGPGRILDIYSVKARWSPAFLVALPLLLACVALIPSLSAWNKLWPLIGGAGVVILIDQLGRDAGKRMQPGLWASCGGAPTTAALRHRDSPNPVLLARRHEKLHGLTGHALPTADEERSDPSAADHVYETVTAVLISRTRQRRKDFPLIFVENCNYGFRRNMLGLRPWGLWVAFASALAALAGLAITLAGIAKFPEGFLSAVLAVSVVALVIWWRVVTRDWVKRAAESYAERLFEATESLGRTACSQQRRPGQGQRNRPPRDLGPDEYPHPSLMTALPRQSELVAVLRQI